MNAYLLLANGMVFAGQSVGAQGVTVGEVVFSTGMVGFQETLTDPSYYGQIITQTYPLIGNYGMNHDDMESDRIWAKGYIVREACTTPSNWRCEETLDSFLKKNNTIGIEGIDTRHLTRIIRESGVMNGAILTTFDPADPANKAETDKLLETIRAYAVTDAVKNVTCAAPEVFNEKGETHIVLMHYGCKRNIVRCLVKRGCKVTVMHHAVQRPRRPRRAGGGHREPPPYLRTGYPHLRHLPGPPAVRSGRRCQDHEAQVRPPRCQPARHRL